MSTTLQMEEEVKKCRKCKEIKPVRLFYKCKTEDDGMAPQCKVCAYQRVTKYRGTVKGALAKLYIAAKGNSKKRHGDAAKFELIKSDIIDIWKNQKRRCYYSGIPMNCDVPQWKVSLERLDPSQGYIATNIVLCCQEFNTICQWSLDKIRNMFDVLSRNITENYHDFSLEVKTPKKCEPIARVVVNGVQHYGCNYCNEVKPALSFNNNCVNGCKECQAKKRKSKSNNPRHVFQTIIGNSKKHMKAKSDRFQRDKTHTLTFDMLVDIFNKQKGLCAISGIPMQFGSHREKNWIVSLDRINPHLGYTKSNVHLICFEFNSCDKTVLKYKKGEEIKKDDGSAGWTKEKFDFFVNNLLENPASKFYGEYMVVKLES